MTAIERLHHFIYARRGISLFLHPGRTFRTAFATTVTVSAGNGTGRTPFLWFTPTFNILTGEDLIKSSANKEKRQKNDDQNNNITKHLFLAFTYDLLLQLITNIHKAHGAVKGVLLTL